MTDTNQKLREALQRYGKHDRECGVNNIRFNCACNCGLEAALALPTAAPVVERDALDAARYRWLADCNSYPEAVTLISDGSLTADALGKAIDAAMRKGQL